MQGVTRSMLLGFFALLFPISASAQVVINEIMYNPQGSDSGREWIELYNTGSSDVTMIGGSGKNSWRVSDSSNHTLTDPASGVGRGSLTIPAGGYLVIASDPTEFISGEYAGGSYSVVKSSISLSNSGLTVKLIDGSGATMDSASYTTAQGGNDDGSSLQKQPDGSWLAALPTPGAGNSSVPFVASNSNTTSTTSNATSSATSTASQLQTATQTAAPVSSYVPPPSPSLFADAGGDRTVIVGADVEFDGRAYDKNQILLDTATTRFSWNFGDGATSEGSAVFHHFDYPGTYAAVLSIANARDAGEDTVRVVAEPAALSFLILPDGGVAIENDTSHDLDLSHWIVRESGAAFAAVFTLPKQSKILAKQTMRIARGTLAFAAGPDSSLLYPNGVVALGANQSSAPHVQVVLASTASASTSERAQPAAPAALAAAEKATSSKSKPAPGASSIDKPDATEASIHVPSQPTAVAPAPAGVLEANDASPQVAAAALSVRAENNHRLLWWAGAAALLLLGGAAWLASAGASKKEWNIEER